MTQERMKYLEWQVRMLWNIQHGKCADCGRIHRTSASMEMAHRIANTKINREKYGAEVVDHYLNKGLTCREKIAGHSCNDALNIGNKPHTADLLARAIRLELGET